MLQERGCLLCDVTFSQITHTDKVSNDFSLLSVSVATRRCCSFLSAKVPRMNDLKNQVTLIKIDSRLIAAICTPVWASLYPDDGDARDRSERPIAMHNIKAEHQVLKLVYSAPCALSCETCGVAWARSFRFHTESTTALTESRERWPRMRQSLRFRRRRASKCRSMPLAEITLSNRTSVRRSLNR